MSIVAVINQKGGVGKTTLSTNLSAALANQKKEVLVVDLDPQANLTTHLGFQPEMLDRTIYNALLRRPIECFRNGIPLEQVRYTTPVERMALIPSNLELSSAEVEMVSMMGRETLLRELLEPVQDQYDYIFLDCPPALGLLSMNALASADEVLVPFQTEFFALKGIQQLLDVVDLVRNRRINPELKIGGFVGGLYDARKKLHREMVDVMRERFGDTVFSTVIRNNVALAESSSQGVPIFQYSARSRGAIDYNNLGKEFLKRH